MSKETYTEAMLNLASDCILCAILDSKVLDRG